MGIPSSERADVSEPDAPEGNDTLSLEQLLELLAQAAENEPAG